MTMYHYIMDFHKHIFSVLFPELRLLLDRMEIPLVTKECFEFFKATTQKLSAERRNTTSVGTRPSVIHVSF